jgi:Putative zinc-finger
MKTEGCREWRESLGAYVLGQLREDERAGLDAHLDGCAACRAELSELEPVARIMPLADLDGFAEPVQPPPGLGERIEATIARERRSSRRRRLRFGLALGGATAAAAAVLAIFVFGGGSSSAPEQRVVFSPLPPGVKISATLEPRAYGTEVYMYVEGMPSGTLCRVVLRGPRGVRQPAGSFRYRYGEDEAVLSSALDLSRTRAIVVHAGRQVFVAPVAPSGGV